VEKNVVLRSLCEAESTFEPCYIAIGLNVWIIWGKMFEIFSSENLKILRCFHIMECLHTESDCVGFLKIQVPC
jgi:hypothetical protein